jgi:hypothetical protein
VCDKISLVRMPRVVVGLMAVLITGACGGMDDDDDRTSATVGPDMFEGTATTVDGEEVDLATLADRDLVVWFWAPW